MMSRKQSTSTQPFAGIRIADFSWYGAGPIATRFFANYGAEVIKLESHCNPDGLRRNGPFAGGTPGITLPGTAPIDSLNISGYFANFNSNKLSLQVDLNLPEGREIAKRLVKISDIVIDNFTPRVMERWRLTYQDLVRIKPDIIVANLPMLGSVGPQRDYVGFGFALSSLAGIDHLTGMPDDLPTSTGTNFPDYCCNPCHTTIALLAALRYRRKTGKGQHIEVAQLESTVQILGTALIDYTINGRIQSRRGNSNPSACPHGVYRCKGDDRWCAIAVFTDVEWASLCWAMGREDLVQSPLFGTLQGRLARTSEVDDLVNRWTSSLSPEDVMAILQREGVAAGVVQTAEDALDKDPQLAARNHWVYLDHPEAGRTAYNGETFRLSRTPGDIHSPAPCLGQHTEFVCRDLLGMTGDEVSALREEKVLY
ncbi:MAG: CoA transferase [Dehalococcoidia bacterium]|nr:CoA transferase [Dehalococcoidia bacterium]